MQVNFKIKIKNEQNYAEQFLKAVTIKDCLISHLKSQA